MSLLESPEPPLLSLLTPAERRVAAQLLRHKSNAEIALALGKSRGTVRSQVASILHQFGQPNRNSLLSFLREMQ